MNYLTIIVDFCRNNLTLPLALVISFLVYSIVQYRRSPWRKVPPGPKGWPIIGNALELGESRLWLKFKRWREVYGDIIYLNVAGQSVIILNSPKAATDLLFQRGGNSSDRPRNIVGSEIMTGGMFMVLNSYGNLWKRMRKATHQSLSSRDSVSVSGHQAAQQAESILLALRIARSPSQWYPHIRQASGVSTANLLYGSDSDSDVQGNVPNTGLTDTGDHRVEGIHDFVTRLSALLDELHLVEVFPWMKYIPARFAKWKHVAVESFKRDSAMFERLMKPVHAGIARGDEPTSLMGRICDNYDTFKLSPPESAWLAATMFAAGSETSVGVFTWWMLAMLLHPEAQANAQQELDNVVGRDRVPSLEDYERLPYIRAMVKEALRWRPVNPLGFPHVSTDDDYYEGHFIPANSLMIPNVWLLNQDPLVWGPDAMDFKPERHLDDRGELKKRAPPDMGQESHFTYGFGRRVCVGKHVANNLLFTQIATMLWAMKIERPRDSDDVPVPIDSDSSIRSGLVVIPTPFDIKVTPRFPEAVTILEQENDV